MRLFCFKVVTNTFHEHVRPPAPHAPMIYLDLFSSSFHFEELPVGSSFPRLHCASHVRAGATLEMNGNFSHFPKIGWGVMKEWMGDDKMMTSR